MQSRSQQYAQSAFEAIEKRYEGSAETFDKKKYGVMAHKLPVLVRQAGLVQALGFVTSRGSEEAKNLLDDIAHTINIEDREQLLKQSREASVFNYMHLTRQVLAACLWYKRFAESVLDVSASAEEGREDVSKA